MGCYAPQMLGYRGGMLGNSPGCVITLFKFVQTRQDIVDPSRDAYQVSVIQTVEGSNGQDAWNKIRPFVESQSYASVSLDYVIPWGGNCDLGRVSTSGGTINVRRPVPREQWGGKSVPPPFTEWPIARTMRNGEEFPIVSTVYQGESDTILYFKTADGNYVSADYVTCLRTSARTTKTVPNTTTPYHGLLVAYPGREQVNVIFPLSENSAYRSTSRAGYLTIPAARPLFPSTGVESVGAFKFVRGGSYVRGKAKPMIVAQLASVATSMLNKVKNSSLDASDIIGAIGGAIGGGGDGGGGGGGGGEIPTGDGNIYGGDGGSYAPPVESGGNTGLILGVLGAAAAAYFIAKG